jgi:MarR family transcriptional regulator, transcriptional regulator for hemolysin
MGVETASPRMAGESPKCLSGDLGWLLYRAYFALASELSAAFAPLGVSSRGYHVLAAASSGEHTQSELAEMIGLDKTTMVVTVDELEKAGLAKRRPSREDRRARVIAVTKAGERKVAEGEELIERVQADVLAELPAGERKAFLGALCKLVEGRLSETVECQPALRRREPRAVAARPA